MGMLYVSYLPLAHSLERSATIYMAAWKATHVYFCPDVLQVFEYVPEVKPLAFVGPPRVWEKLEAGIMAALAAEPNERRRKIAWAPSTRRRRPSPWNARASRSRWA